MDESTRQFEEQLGKLRPPALSQELLARLEAAADGSLSSTPKTQQSLEARLGSCRPSPLNEALLTKLEAAMAGVDFQTASTVLPFPTQRQLRRPLRHWSAAAAVALLGALCALWMQPKDHGSTVGLPMPAHGASNSAPGQLPMVPADAIRQISNTSDEGVIWPSSDRPHRVVKVVYTEQITLKQADGSSKIVERPRVEYYLVPTDSE